MIFFNFLLKITIEIYLIYCYNNSVIIEAKYGKEKSSRKGS